MGSVGSGQTPVCDKPAEGQGPAPPSFQQRVFGHFTTLLADADPAVRRRAISAAAYPAWPELQRMASEDADAEVRARRGRAGSLR